MSMFAASSAVSSLLLSVDKPPPLSQLSNPAWKTLGKLLDSWKPMEAQISNKIFQLSSKFPPKIATFHLRGKIRRTPSFVGYSPALWAGTNDPFATLGQGSQGAATTHRKPTSELGFVGPLLRPAANTPACVPLLRLPPRDSAPKNPSSEGQYLPIDSVEFQALSIAI